jgi:long-chain acyl-CoA synthetase
MPSMRQEAHYGDRIVRCFADRATSFHDLLAASVLARPEAEALICGAQRLSWRALGGEVARVAGALRERGIGAGDRVALFVSNRPAFVIALFAVQRLGAIAVPIGTREQKEGLQWILGHCGARAVFFDAELADRVPDSAALPGLELRVACERPEIELRSLQTASADAPIVATAAPGDLVFSALAPAAPMLDTHPVREEDTAVILYTSGTTGRPKGAMLTHFGIVHSALHFMHCMKLTAADRSLLAVPASHVTGLIAHVATLAACGGTLIVMPAFKASEFLVLASRERMTHTVMVPAMYNLALLQPDFDRHDLSAWRIGAFGGAPMPAATIDALAQRLPGLVLMNAYGATETTSPVTQMPAGLNRAHIDSVGVPMPCAEVLVVDDEGRELPPGEVGELWIAGPMVVRGYWNDPAATAREFTAGWWHSRFGRCRRLRAGVRSQERHVESRRLQDLQCRGREPDRRHARCRGSGGGRAALPGARRARACLRARDRRRRRCAGRAGLLRRQAGGLQGAGNRFDQPGAAAAQSERQAAQAGAARGARRGRVILAGWPAAFSPATSETPLPVRPSSRQ